MEICEGARLVDVRRWKEVGVRLVMDELRVHKVVDLAW
jgi:hypothetical protein